MVEWNKKSLLDIQLSKVGRRIEKYPAAIPIPP